MEEIDNFYPFSETPIAYHFNDLGPGLHEIRIDNAYAMRVDAFETPATNVAYSPLAEWFDTTPLGNNAPFFGTIGMVSGIATGDIDLDGTVELVFGSHTFAPEGDFYVYNADGSDSGDGDPIKWSVEYGGSRAILFGTPAIGNLDDDPESEIIITEGDDIRAYNHDGTLMWTITETLTTFDVLGAPALGNLDADPEPEIVLNLEDGIAVIEPDGTIAWQETTQTDMIAPMLADLNGDTRLDIVSAEWGSVFDNIPSTVYAWDYNFGSPTLLWSTVITPQIAFPATPTFENGLLGSHAIADIDGDGLPEILASHYGYITALNHDGTELWQTELEPGFPGGVSVADIDGDGEVEIITGMKYLFDEGDPLDEEDDRFGKLYALNADGTLLWDVIAEDSTSANSAAVLDLNGDDIYEVAWNGKEQGFTIFNGADGAVLFNEPEAFTISGSDYPIIVDVDGDDAAEIVAPTLRGPVVFGMDSIWADARSIWNQQTYHITNVNDDLSIPVSELDSWAVHNTYHTQYNREFALPVFGVGISHTVGSENVAVDGGSFNVVPDEANDPDYGWGYRQTMANDVETRSFDSVLTDLQPGETRMVAAGTTVSYTLEAGINQITLPPLFVTVPHIIALDPESQTVNAGADADFIIKLTNPADRPDNYNLAILATDGRYQFMFDASVAMPAAGAVDVPLTISTPQDTDELLTFTVQVTNGDGAMDSAVGELVVVDAFDLVVMPALQSAESGVPTTYDVTLTNHLDIPQTVDLSAASSAEVDVPATVLIPASGETTVDATVTGFIAGANLFTVNGVSDSGAADSDSAILDVLNERGVDVAITPEAAESGVESLIVYSVTVTNEGQAFDTFDLAVDVPTGWTEQLLANGVEISEISLPGGVFNPAELTLLVTAPDGTTPDDYPVSVTATAQGAPAINDTATANTTINTLGVSVIIDGGSRDTVIDPSLPQTWMVTVTNEGSQTDTFDLSAGGVFANAGTFTPASVTLDPDESAMVQLDTDAVPFLTPGTYILAVQATSQADGMVRDVATENVIVEGTRGVDVEWLVDEQQIEEPMQVTYLLVLTNTGTVSAEYTLSGDFDPLLGDILFETIIVPARQTIIVPVTVLPFQEGMFFFTVTAVDGTSRGNISDSDTATLIVSDMLAITLSTANTQTTPPPLALLLTTTLLLLTTLYLTHRRRPRRSES